MVEELQTDCLICRIVAGTASAHVVWEDAGHVAFLDVNPMRPGHTVLVPRAHARTVYDLPPDGFAALFAVVRRLGPALAWAAGAERAAIAVEGYGIAHAHVHLVPTTGGNQLDPCRQAPASADDLDEMAARLRRDIHLP